MQIEALREKQKTSKTVKNVGVKAKIRGTLEFSPLHKC